MRTIKKVGRVIQCNIDMWVPGATTLTLTRGTIIFDSFGQIGTIKISDIDLAACDPVITDGTDEEIYEQVVELFNVSHGGSVTVDVNGVDMATSDSNISLGLVYTGGDPVPFVKVGLDMVVERTGYAARPLDVPIQLPIVNNGDSAWALGQGAFTYTIPYTKTGLYDLDTTHPDGDVLIQDNPFGNTARFTDLSGTKDTTFTTSIVCGDGVTRTATSFIDHYYGIVYHAMTDATSRVNYLTHCARAFGATYGSNAVYFANVGMGISLYSYNALNNHLRRFGLASIAIYLGEVSIAGQAYAIGTNGLLSNVSEGTGLTRHALFFSKYNP